MRIARVARYGCVGINITPAYICCWAKSLTKLGIFPNLRAHENMMKVSVASTFGAVAFVALVAHTVAAPTTIQVLPYAGSASSDPFPPAGSRSSYMTILFCY
jgi:hypothetical protein